MNEDTGAHYLSPWPVGDTVQGLVGLGLVIKSSNNDFQDGDLIQGTLQWPWKRYFVLNLKGKNEYYQKVNTISAYVYTAFCSSISNLG